MRGWQYFVAGSKMTVELGEATRRFPALCMFTLRLCDQRYDFGYRGHPPTPLVVWRPLQSCWLDVLAHMFKHQEHLPRSCHRGVQEDHPILCLAEIKKTSTISVTL
jgi:hypothetical protein